MDGVRALDVNGDGAKEGISDGFRDRERANERDMERDRHIRQWMVQSDLRLGDAVRGVAVQGYEMAEGERIGGGGQGGGREKGGVDEIGIGVGAGGGGGDLVGRRRMGPVEMCVVGDQAGSLPQGCGLKRISPRVWGSERERETLNVETSYGESEALHGETSRGERETVHGERQTLSAHLIPGRDGREGVWGAAGDGGWGGGKNASERADTHRFGLRQPQFSQSLPCSTRPPAGDGDSSPAGVAWIESGQERGGGGGTVTLIGRVGVGGSWMSVRRRRIHLIGVRLLDFYLSHQMLCVMRRWCVYRYIQSMYRCMYMNICV